MYINIASIYLKKFGWKIEIFSVIISPYRAIVLFKFKYQIKILSFRGWVQFPTGGKVRKPTYVAKEAINRLT